MLEHPNDRWSADGRFEVVLLLYLKKVGSNDKHDVDDRLKDVLDGFQGAFFGKSVGERRAMDRIIKNDASV